MAHTDIILTEEHGIFIPSQSQVPVVKGDTVAFATSDSSQVALFFSPEAAPVLSPVPSAPTVVAPGNKAEFTFTSSDTGAYSVFFEKDASTPPAYFPVKPSNQLLLEIDPGSPFGGPVASPRTGS
jgi:hypothetical protein